MGKRECVSGYKTSDVVGRSNRDHPSAMSAAASKNSKQVCTRGKRFCVTAGSVRGKRNESPAWSKNRWTFELSEGGWGNADADRRHRIIIMIYLEGKIDARDNDSGVVHDRQ